jgi:hypothetical protein
MTPAAVATKKASRKPRKDAETNAEAGGGQSEKAAQETAKATVRIAKAAARAIAAAAKAIIADGGGVVLLWSSCWWR